MAQTTIEDRIGKRATSTVFFRAGLGLLTIVVILAAVFGLFLSSGSVTVRIDGGTRMFICPTPIEWLLGDNKGSSQNAPYLNRAGCQPQARLRFFLFSALLLNALLLAWHVAKMSTPQAPKELMSTSK